MVWSGKWNDVKFDGGVLCLDFTNTIHDRTVELPQDYLRGFDDLVQWLTLTNALPRPVIRNLTLMAGGTPHNATRVLAKAKDLRELLYSIFSTIAYGEKVTPADLTRLNEQISKTMEHVCLVQREGEIMLDWNYSESGLGQALWPVVKSAMDLLLSGKHDRIGVCPRCRWLFLDTSKNGLRRWCSMDTCGSIDKSLRYYYRSKAGSEPGTR